MFSVEDITKGFGSRMLLENVSFKINPRERVGLVGRNGHGKTTLIRMIAGEEAPESGGIIMPKLYRLGYVKQHLDFTKDTVLKEGMEGLTAAERDHYWKVEKILMGLGFSERDFQRHPREFSGGFQVRLNLAKVLISEPDLLLLDEPTNYLDITSIRWVERFLRQWPRELILITHDRSFMDSVITHTIGIHRRRIRKVAGDTGKYYEQIAQEEEIYEKTRQNEERRRRDMELFISRFRAKARLAGLVQSRVKTLEKMEKKNKLEKIETLDFAFREKPFDGRQVMEAKNLAFGYDPDRLLVQGLSFTVKKGDRVCIIGKNGRGKTTLLKLLARVLTPRAGGVRYNPNVEAGVFEQTNVADLMGSRSVLEEILFAHPDVNQQLARNICGAMMFEGDDALKRIEVLSGGEKSRVMLGRLLATPVNLLFLDEPTNHLDMDSCDALLVALDNFSGAVVMVTHNEGFLHTLAQKLIVFRNDGVLFFEGGYQRFLDKLGWEEETAARRGVADLAPDAKNDGLRVEKKEIRRRRSEIVAARSKALKPLEREIARIEGAIEEKETRLGELNQAMQAAAEAQDGGRIESVSRAIHESRQAVEGFYERLAELYQEKEEKEAAFQEMLDQDS